MERKYKLGVAVIASLVMGFIFSAIMGAILFTQVPAENSILGGMKSVIMWTAGLPLLFSVWLSAASSVKELFCSPAGQSTFGCWAGNSFSISILIYWVLFGLIYYFFFWRKSKNK